MLLRLEALVEKQTAVIEQQQQTIASLKTELNRANTRITELERIVGPNSSNSSLPPSADLGRPKRVVSPSGRAPGGQKGHKGSSRSMLPVEQVDQIVPVRPTACSACQGALTPLDSPPVRFQVTDLPPIKPVVIEYQLHSGRCCSCQRQTQASLPSGVPPGQFGPNLIALSSYLTTRMRVSHRHFVEFLEQFAGLKLSLGTVTQLQRRSSEALAWSAEEVMKTLRQSQVVHVDETGFRWMGEKAWVWGASNTQLSAFIVDEHRDTAAAKKLLGDDYKGMLVRDRWHTWSWIPKERTQLCWAHLRRDFKSWEDSGGPEGRRLGAAALRVMKRAFVLWKDFKEGRLDRRALKEGVEPLKGRMSKLLNRAAKSGSTKARGQAKKMRKEEESFWRFVEVEGVEPTNNQAEREIRPVVCIRKMSLGVQSEAGRLHLQRSLTVGSTLARQGRRILDFMRESVLAFYKQLELPSALPGPSLA